jgi:succinate dehydrogenase / fumarate reductase cytochrome b subunit
MNAVAILWPTAYNQVCEFLGANWYALVASIGLAALFIIHIIYALWLTLQNRRARGADRYAVTARQPQVEWSSKNMLVLGIVVIAFLVVHMIQFWAKMQLQEVIGGGIESCAKVNGAAANPAMGTLFIQMAFQQVWTPIVYIIGFIALWFHMNHGFWSMFHTIGWDNNIWISRFKKTAKVWSSIVVALFIIEAVVFTVRAHDNFYTTDAALQEQYAKVYDDEAKEVAEKFIGDFDKMIAPVTKNAMTMSTEEQMKLRDKVEEMQANYIRDNADDLIRVGNAITAANDSIFPDASAAATQNIKQLGQLVQQVRAMANQLQDPQLNR